MAWLVATQSQSRVPKMTGFTVVIDLSLIKLALLIFLLWCFRLKRITEFAIYNFVAPINSFVFLGVML